MINVNLFISIFNSNYCFTHYCLFSGNVDKLIVTVYKKSSRAALIKWRQFENHDPRTLLGYVVYFIEAPYKNVSIYDRRDACGDDGLVCILNF